MYRRFSSRGRFHLAFRTSTGGCLAFTVSMWRICLYFSQLWMRTRADEDPIAIDVKPFLWKRCRKEYTGRRSHVPCIKFNSSCGPKIALSSRPVFHIDKHESNCVMRKICKRGKRRRRNCLPYDVVNTIVGSVSTFVDFDKRDGDDDAIEKDLKLVPGTRKKQSYSTRVLCVALSRVSRLYYCRLTRTPRMTKL